MDNLGLLLLSLAALRLAHEEFLCYAHHLVGSVLVEDNHIVDIGTVANELVLLQRCSDEAFLNQSFCLLIFDPVAMGKTHSHNGIVLFDRVNNFKSVRYVTQKYR